MSCRPEPPIRVLVAVPSTGRPTTPECVRSVQEQLASTTSDRCSATVAVLLNNVPAGVDSAALGRGAATRFVEADGIADVRNAAVALALASGYSHLLFFDDDQVACDGWWEEFVAAVERDTFDVLLGPVDVEFPVGAPRWALDNPQLFRGSTASRPDGPYDGPVYSGNTMVKLGAAATGDRFSPALNAGGEDTDFFHRLRQRGATVGWVAGARAVEVQQPDRCTVRGLARRRFHQGRTARRLERLGVFAGHFPPAVRHPARLAARLVVLAVRTATLRRVTGPALETLVEACFVAGVCAEEISIRTGRISGAGAARPGRSARNEA